MMTQSSRKYVFTGCFACLILLALLSVSMMCYLEDSEDPRFLLPNLTTLHLIWYIIGSISLGFSFILAKKRSSWLERGLLCLSVAVLAGAFLQGETHHGLPYFEFGKFRINAAEASVLGFLVPIASIVANRAWSIILISGILGLFLWIGSANAILCLGFAISTIAFLDYLDRRRRGMLLLSITSLCLSLTPILKEIFSVSKDASISILGSYFLVLYDLAAEANGHTEFILSHILERFGVIIACCSVLLILVFIGQLIALSSMTVDRKARFVTVGFASFLMGQVLFNLLVVTGFIGNPASGVSLPFVSYGGSQLVLELAIAGAVLGFLANSTFVVQESLSDGDREKSSQKYKIFTAV